MGFSEIFAFFCIFVYICSMNLFNQHKLTIRKMIIAGSELSEIATAIGMIYSLKKIK